jgi:small subunit ribosomal protein S27Ae
MADKPAKAPVKSKKKHSRKYKAYEISGGMLKRKNLSCPKCGPGVFLASHKNRRTCGSCGYMEKI